MAKNVGGIASDQLKSFVQRIEKLEEETANLRQDTKEVFEEAKISGFDVKILKTVIRLKKMDPEKRAQEEEMIKLYADALDA
ncbi:MAG: DUF2312 domain-containing protein [Alphaproteobacteria bacterium]|nr:DUF2312 domain-containing protein [Alphaproteobacteria bacterium]